MPSWTTIYRAAVMIATGVIVVKGWQLYGPPTEKVKALAVTAFETVQTTWDKTRARSADATTATDDRQASAAPPAVALPGRISSPPSLTPGPSAVAGVTAPELATASAPAIERPQASPENDGLAGAANAADGMSELYARLTALGAGEFQLAPWGSSGQLFRFTCRARLADTPFHARHFEAVAASPAAAVEEVVAEVSSWRVEQRQQTAMR